MVNNNDTCFGFTPGEELTSRCFSYHVLKTGCRTTEEQQSFVYLLLLMKQREMLVQMLVRLRRLINVCRVQMSTPNVITDLVLVVLSGKTALPVTLCPGEERAPQIPAHICKCSSCAGPGACSSLFLERCP